LTVNFNDFALVLGMTLFGQVGLTTQQGRPKPQQAALSTLTTAAKFVSGMKWTQEISTNLLQQDIK